MKNVVPIRVGPRESTPEIRASLRKASVQAVRDRLAEHSRISAKTWIYVGKELIGTKDAADMDGRKVFASLFAKSAAERGEALRYPFSLQTGYKLMAVATSFAQWAKVDCLPSAWRTLYELSRVSPARLRELIESGSVHPMTSRAEAIKLTAKKKPAKKPTTDERAYRAARRLLLKIAEPDRRAVEFLNLMHDCGITLEQLQEIEE